MGHIIIHEDERHIQNLDEHDTLWARIEKDAEERIDLLKRIEALEQK